MRTDAEVNALAKSWGAEPQPADGIENGGLPCLQVAGVTVWLYRKDGRMAISVDTDDADFAADTPGSVDAIPMRFSVNGQPVWAADAAGRETYGGMEG